MASSVSDSILIIKDYNHNEVLVRYLFDDKEIASLKFSPNGKILVVGFNTG